MLGIINLLQWVSNVYDLPFDLTMLDSDVSDAASPRFMLEILPPLTCTMVVIWSGRESDDEALLWASSPGSAATVVISTSRFW